MRHGSSDEVLKATTLLSALLREAYLAHEGKLSYRPALIDARAVYEMIIANLSHDDFRVRAWSARSLRGLAVLPGSAAEKELSQLLDDENWFVRLLAIIAVNEIADMSEYLPWAAATELEPVVRRQIELLQGKDWQIEEMP